MKYVTKTPNIISDIVNINTELGKLANLSKTKVLLLVADNWGALLKKSMGQVAMKPLHKIKLPKNVVLYVPDTLNYNVIRNCIDKLPPVAVTAVNERRIITRTSDVGDVVNNVDECFTEKDENNDVNTVAEPRMSALYWDKMTTALMVVALIVALTAWYYFHSSSFLSVMLLPYRFCRNQLGCTPGVAKTLWSKLGYTAKAVVTKAPLWVNVLGIVLNTLWLFVLAMGSAIPLLKLRLALSSPSWKPKRKEETSTTNSDE
jgi:hypothetical protein